MIFDAQDGGPTRIETYAYALARAGCDDAHEAAGQWWGLVRGHFDAGATARPELGLSDEERDFLRDQAGAIVHEHAPGCFHAVFYPTRERLDIAWRAVTAWQPPAASCAPVPGAPRP